jgi:hypothetical protein
MLVKSVDELKIRTGNYMEGGMKRFGALFLKSCAVMLLTGGLIAIFVGLANVIQHNRLEEPLSVGAALSIIAGLLWLLGRKLDEAAKLIRYRRQQNRVVRLARDRGGRLTVTEAAADTGLTVEEAAEILKRMADGGYVELEVTDSGLMVYRFPEILYAHEKHWSRGVESA